MPLAVFRAVMETNYFGVIRCIQAVLPAMRERGAAASSTCRHRRAESRSRRWAVPGLASSRSRRLSEVLAQEVKAFNIRVAIVRAGHHRHARRPGYCRGPEPLVLPASSSVCRRCSPPALQTRASGLDGRPDRCWRSLRAVPRSSGILPGPTGLPSSTGGKSLNDEEWVAWGALDDDAWYQRMKQDFGMDLRPLAPTA